MRFIIMTISLLFILSGISAGAGKKISENGNKHNFSSSNTGVNYRAIPSDDPRSQQICVFCHTPHNSSGQGPLWNRRETAVTFFKKYSSSGLAIDDPGMIGSSEYGQPSGSSRLCLSCHDGVTALGAVFTTPLTNIHFIDAKNSSSGPDVKIAYETYSTHHPVSFKYNQTVRNLLTDPPYSKSFETLPPTSFDANVKLDRQERMQCTTCHDPHQNKATDPDNPVTPFWTTTDYDKVCLSCHSIKPLDPWKP
jgi:hypothetical protein